MSQLHLLLQFGIHKERLYFYRLYLEVQELESSKKSSLFEVLRVVEHFPTLATIKRERKCYVLKLLPTVFRKINLHLGAKQVTIIFALTGSKNTKQVRRIKTAKLTH